MVHRDHVQVRLLACTAAHNKYSSGTVQYSRLIVGSGRAVATATRAELQLAMASDDLQARAPRVAYPDYNNLTFLPCTCGDSSGCYCTCRVTFSK